MAAVGTRLTTVEGQLANARYQNQGLRTLLNKMEIKYNEAVKQCTAEKNVRLLKKSNGQRIHKHLLISETEKSR